MKKALVAALVLAFVGAAAPTAVLADGHDEVAKQVMARAYEQWEAFDKRDIAKAMEQVADEYTEFNRVVATRVDGKALSHRMAEAGNQDSAEGILAEMLNPKVQVYGNQGQGRHDHAEPSQVHPRVRQQGRHVDARARELWSRSRP
jgi:hypothetical protein